MRKLLICLDVFANREVQIRWLADREIDELGRCLKSGAAHPWWDARNFDAGAERYWTDVAGGDVAAATADAFQHVVGDGGDTGGVRGQRGKLGVG
ncbi:MAG: hypothetical protein AAGD38_21100, partial [Acidobacteriota bacterium]